MDSPEEQKPEIRPELNKTERKKGGFFASLLAKLGFGGGSGAGGLGGIGGAGGGGAGGLFSTGLLASKTGMIVAALIGTTVAGGVGMLGYKALSGDSSFSSAGQHDEFSSLFAPKPKADAKAADAGAKPANGNSDSLSMMAQANGGGGLEGADKKPEEAKPAAAAPAPAAAAVNNTAAVNNAVGAPAASSLPAGHLSAKKIGALDSSTGGSSSGAHGGGPAGVAGSPQALLAGARNGKSSAMDSAALGRAMLSSRRGARFDGGRGAGRQLLAVNRDQSRGGNSRATGLTIDNSSLGSTLPGDDAGTPGGISSGKEGAKDKPASIAAAVTQNPDQPAPIFTAQDITPWADKIMNAKIATGVAMASLLLGIVMLHLYYTSYVENYNAGWFEGLATCLQTKSVAVKAQTASIGAMAQSCLAYTGIAIPPVPNPCAAAYASALEATELAHAAMGAKASTLAASMVAKAKGSDAKGAAVTAGSVTLAAAAGAVVAADLGANQVAQAGEVSAIQAAAAHIAGAVDVATKAYDACVATQLTAAGITATACAAPPVAIAVVPLCPSAAAALASCPSAVSGVNGLAATLAGIIISDAPACLPAALAQAQVTSKLATFFYIAAGACLASAAVASGLLIKYGTDIMQGPYKQMTQGLAFAASGAIFLGITAWAGYEAITASGTAIQEQAGASDGELELSQMGFIATFTSIPTVLGVVAAAGVLAAGTAVMSDSKTKCSSLQECNKFKDDPASSSYNSPWDQMPGKNPLDEFLA